MNYRALRAFGLLLLMLSLGALSCDLADLTGGGKPTVVITSPPSGSQYQEGQEVAIQSTSTDAKGIARVELVVDGITVRTDPLPNPQPQFALIQTWKATQGTHTLTVRAYNTANAPSDPIAISVSVLPSIALGATPSPSAVPTLPGATPGSSTPIPGGCSNDAAFVADVTVPNGTVLAAGQSFNKIWRVRNAGTCTWGPGYDFVFVGGEAMSGATVVAVPATAPGATADLLVAMTAPAAQGTHTGQWRLRAGGVSFGVTVNVSINVPPSAPVCPGPPVIASFSASPNPISAGNSTTLSWGAVTNATSASIDHGVGGVATPGSTSVNPATTTTYTLTATGCGGTATSQVTVTVNPGVGVPAQQSPANGAVLRVFPRTATFNWSNVSFPGGVKYNIEIQINTGTWQPHVTASDLAGSNYTMASFSGDNQGRWRVWATSPTAGDGAKTGWWEFRFNTGASQYSGNWLNDDSGTSGITRLNITNTGQTLHVHGYGKCTPTDCDWGTRNGAFNGEPFTILFDFGGGLTHQLTITLNNNAGTQLKVVDVGSSSGTHTYTFHK